MAARRAFQRGVRRKAILCFGHAYREMAITGVFPLAQLLTHPAFGGNLAGAVDLVGNRLNLAKQFLLIVVEWLEGSAATIDHGDDMFCQSCGAGRPFGPVIGFNSSYT